MAAAPPSSRQFAVAFSFPGEHRGFVEQVAKALLAEFGAGDMGKARIFYDAWHEGKVIGYGSNRKLQTIYGKGSDLIVPFYCEDYLKKDWCGVELRAIEEILFDQEYDRVLPFRFDRVEIPSSFKTDIFPIVTERRPEDIARLIIERYKELHPVAPEREKSSKSPISVDISRIIKYAPTELIGRETETKLLSDAWDNAVGSEPKRPHILTFVALGGEGKTSLVAKWAADLAHQGWPGCDAVLAWSFYHQGTDEKTADSSDLFLKHALTEFGDVAMAGSAQGGFDKGRRLAQLVGARRALLILDGLEPLQYAPTSPTPGELKDQGLAALLKGLAATNNGLCIVTTRYAIPDLRAFLGKSVQEEKLTSLSKEAGVALLRFLGVKGAPIEFERLVEDVKGHALTLNLLGSFLRDAHSGDIRKRDLIKLEEADSEEQGGHAFRVMDAYVESFENSGKTAEDRAKGRRALAVLCLLGLFDRPAIADCLNALWKGEAIAGLTEPLIGLSEARRNMSLQRLEVVKLLTVSRDAAGTLLSLDAHPLVREYFGRHVRQKKPDAWRVAHRRLYEHLCATTKEGDQPTLEDLQPLYQAVAHGCQAGSHQKAYDEVYFARIRKGNEYYSIKRLGAVGSDLGGVACFFETPWSRVSPNITETTQAVLLNLAASWLHALGRLTEALDPMRAAVGMRVKEKAWSAAANVSTNLSNLDLSLGNVESAVRDAEQSVGFADKGDDKFWRMGARAYLGDALNQMGRRDEAEAHFRAAEQLQAEERTRVSPVLYSLTGFQYCDLQLTEAERAAWKRTTGIPRSGSPGVPLGDSGSETLPEPTANTAGLLNACRAVFQRATMIQKRRTGLSTYSLLDVALDHLTLGRAALYGAILKAEADRPQPDTAIARREIDAAVTGLRRASQQDHLAPGLLTRAWLRGRTGIRTGSDSAQNDLEEAREIAERGSMPLILADIHLHRARLFFRESSYPWDSPQADLAQARRYIEKHGYWRRKEELEDAEKAINKTSPQS